MLMYPAMNPIAFHLGPVSVHWYGLMYLVGLLVGWRLLLWRLKSSAFHWPFTDVQVGDILFYAALGIVLGGRMGYMLFYAWPEFIHHPLSLFKIWQGGMSFHGGLIGVILSLSIYAKGTHKSLGDITDFVAPVVPIGLGAGRIGNFINGELWGRITDWPWGMVFPGAGDFPRHPSQLYEFFFEGLLLFIILWIFSMKPRPRWAVSGLFLCLYGIMRFLLEFFREPDPQLGFVALGWVTQGQLLCFPMIIVGFALMGWAYSRKPLCSSI